MSDLPARNGGQILVEALLRNAVDTVYCIPGESYLPVLDALHDARSIRTIVTRHEGAASNMADAYGKRFRPTPYLRELAATGGSFPA